MNGSRIRISCRVGSRGGSGLGIRSRSENINISIYSICISFININYINFIT